MFWLPLCSVIIGILFYYVWINPKTKTEPPGPFKWPIIGNILHMYKADSRYPHLALQKLADVYGDVMSLKLGNHETIVLSSFELIRDMMKKEELTSKYEFPFTRDRAYGKPLGIIHSSGESWNTMRRYTMSTLREFGFGKKNTMQELMKREITDLLNTMTREMETNCGVLRVDNYFNESIVNILWASVSGNRFSSTTKNPKEIIDLNTRYLELISMDRIGVLYPFLNNVIPQLTGFNELQKLNIRLQNYMKDIIQKTRDTDANIDTRSFIGAFLQEIDKQENPHFTEEQLIVVLMDLFLGGSETTSSLLSFSLLYMVLNPKVQERVYKEIYSTREGQEYLTLEDLKRLPYTHATILEIFRISRIIPIPFGRVASCDITVKGYSIPKNSLVIYNLNSVAMDKTFWKDPEVFRPERFLNDQMDITNHERVPLFGFGKRVCPGEVLARSTFLMYFTTMMMKIRMSTLPGDTPCMNPRTSSNTLGPKPFSVFAQLRN